MGRGNPKEQVKQDHICPKCHARWDTVSLMTSCCEKERKKNSSKKGGIAWNSGATGSGSQSGSKQDEPDQKGSEQQPKGQEKGKGTAK